MVFGVVWRPQDVCLLEFLIHGLPGRVSGKAGARLPWRGAYIAVGTLCCGRKGKISCGVSW
jgi:hypothetical protein